MKYYYKALFYHNNKVVISWESHDYTLLRTNVFSFLTRSPTNMKVKIVNIDKNEIIEVI